MATATNAQSAPIGADREKIERDRVEAEHKAAEADRGKAQPGPQAQAEGNTKGGNPNGDAGEDKTIPSDPDARKSVGGANPAQPASAAADAPIGTGADVLNGNALSQNLASGAEMPNPASLPVIPGVVPMPSEGGGFSPIPSKDTGTADSNTVGYTQAVQRLVEPEDQHPVAQALGTITNIPPGSRPIMVDPVTGRGLRPPQAG